MRCEQVTHAFKEHDSYFRYDYSGYYVSGSGRDRTPNLTMMGVGEDEVAPEEDTVESGYLSPDLEVKRSSLALIVFSAHTRLPLSCSSATAETEGKPEAKGDVACQLSRLNQCYQ